MAVTRRRHWGVSQLRPTAQISLAETAEMLNSTTWGRLIVCSDSLQALPSQWRNSGCGILVLAFQPTAQASLVAGAATAHSRLLARPGSGLATCVQVLPSQ